MRRLNAFIDETIENIHEVMLFIQPGHWTLDDVLASVPSLPFSTCESNKFQLLLTKTTTPTAFSPQMSHIGSGWLPKVYKRERKRKEWIPYLKSSTASNLPPHLTDSWFWLRDEWNGYCFDKFTIDITNIIPILKVSAQKSSQNNTDIFP